MTDLLNNLPGGDLSTPVKVMLLFAAIVLAVLLLIWVIRRLLGGTFVSGGRGRHLRLAVMDATPVDSRRRLVLVRRDDVEHLILIGGPTDLVVEQNIRLNMVKDVAKESGNIHIPAEEEPDARTAEITRAIEMPPERRFETPRAEPPRTVLPSAPQLSPLVHRPAPAPQPPVAPYLPPRPATPPPAQVQPQPQTSRPPILAPRPLSTMAPPVRPATATVPQVAPVSAAMASRPEPEVPVPPIAPVAQTTPKPADTSKLTESDLDESMLADISEGLTLEDDDISPEVSLEKEMESLLGTLDTRKDRIS